MKKIFLLVLCLIGLAASAQQTVPVNPVQKPQGTWYLEPSTGVKWTFDGTSWYPFYSITPPNTVLTGLSMSVVSSTLTVHTGTWRINNQVYTLGSNTNFTLQARDSVYSRYETVYATGVNNGIGIKVGVLSPTPIQPSVGADTLIVGAVLITPTQTTIIPPGPANEFVFSQPLVQQSYANPWIRTLRSDTIKIGGHYILPPIDGTSGQVIQTDGAGNLFWSNQAIYLPLYPITISANNIGVDTAGSTRGLVTHGALLDTLRKNAAHFNPKQFIIGNDTINLNPRDTTTVDSVLGMKNGRLYKGKGGSGGTYTGSHGVGLVGSDFRIATGTLNGNVDLSTDVFSHFNLKTDDGSGDIAQFSLFNGVATHSFTQSGAGTSSVQTGSDGSDAFAKISYSQGSPHKSITLGTSHAGLYTEDIIDHIGLNGAEIFPLTLGTQYAQYIKVDSIAKAKADSVKGTITGGVTSITPGVGFLSHTPITTSGTMNIDTASTIVTKTFAGRYVTNSSTTAFTNKSGNISQWTNDSGYITSASVPVAANPTASAGTSAVNGSATTFMRSDAAPKVDSSAFRTVANSQTLAQTQTALNLKANIASPTFTGTPAAPTASLGTNTTQLATTAFVLANAVSNPMTTLGDIIYENATPTLARLAGNTTSTQKFLTQTGTGSVSAAPAWTDLFGGTNTWSGAQTFSNATTTFSGGLISMTNGTSNYINFGTVGFAAPSFTTRSLGTKFILYADITGSTTDYGIGLESSAMWLAVPSTGEKFKFYTGTTVSGDLDNTQIRANKYFGYIGTSVAAPSFTTRSAGTRVVYFPSLDGSNADYATGLNTNVLWWSVPQNNSTYSYKWYGGTTNIATLDGTGVLNLPILTASAPLQADASKNIISSPVGQTTLVSGTKAITITGLTTSSKAFVQGVTQGGTVSTTFEYAAVCTANTLTITALTNGNVTNTLDTSTLNYFVVQ